MQKVFIIAEAGVNHNGSLSLAKKLVDMAVEAGCDCVKFQTAACAKNVVTRYAKKAEYQIKATAASKSDENQLAMLEELTLKFEDFSILNDYCKERNILFLSTAFDMQSVDFLHSLDMPCFKIPSGEITNLPYLRKINAYKKEVILSTGMANLEEVQEALNILKDCKVQLLHCTTEYPCPFDEVNLKAMQAMHERFSLPVGYSDHTKGIEVAIAAVALGAKVIEKHITLDKEMQGPDHKASIEIDELKQMVNSIRNIEKALGSFEKKATQSEIKNKEIARRSIVASKKIAKNEIFSEENTTVKRPSKGLSPMLWDSVIGQKAHRDFEEDEYIEIKSLANTSSSNTRAEAEKFGKFSGLNEVENV